MTVGTITITPLGGHLGARVDGVDVSALEPDVFATIATALHEHLVLFFPQQHLTDESHMAFAQRFGSVFTHPIARLAGRTTTSPEHIIDDSDHPPFQDQWHTDVSWVSEPPRVGTLRAIDLPARGGDTLWASMYAAHDLLSPTMRRMLEGIEAEHWVGEGRAFEDKSGDGTVARLREQFPPVVHPVIGVHPVTQRPYLYVNPGFTQSIVGASPRESRALLDLLFVHAANPSLQLRYSWTVGDLGVWDEIPTHHFAAADHYPERREMARVTLS